MTSSVPSIAYQDLLDQKATVEQDIRGLQYLMAPTVSADLMAAYQAALAKYNHRLELIVNLLEAWDALANDGYPELPVFTLPPGLQSEHDAQLADLRAGAGVFGGGAPPSGQAVTGTMTVGEFHDPLPATRNRKE